MERDTAMSTALEKRVTKALTSGGIASADLAGLLGEVDVAIAAAEVEQLKTLDPLVSPDAVDARKAMDDATFMRDRLLSLRPRLDQRLQEVQAEEYFNQWRTEYEMLKAKRDELAAELSKLYPDFATKIADLFSRMSALVSELSRLHQTRPAGISLHLLEPELVARGLERFTTNQPSLVNEVRLPAFEPGQQPA
jgi:hypothetical protein